MKSGGRNRLALLFQVRISGNFAMRALPCFLSMLALAGTLASGAKAAEQINWQSDVEAAKRLAARTNRLVVLHFWAPWCGPCMRLEREVFNQPGVGEALEAHYVPVKINLDQAQSMARQYGVQAIPADVVITPQGKLVQKLQSPGDARRYTGQLTQVAVAFERQYQSQFASADGGEATATAADEIGDAFARNPTHGARDAQVAADDNTGVPADEYCDVNDAPPAGDRYADYRNRREPVAAPTEPSPATEAPATEAPVAPSYARQTTTTWSHDPAQSGYRDPVQQTANNEPLSPRSAENSADSRQLNQPAGNASSSHALFGPPTGRTVSQQQPARQPAAVPALPPGNPPLGMDGYCPVHLTESQQWQRGDARWGAIHRGRTYLFVSQACQQKFLASPDRYSPVLEGHDPVVAVEENKLVAGKREFGVFYEGRVYLFAAEATLDRFSTSPERYMQALQR
jgi:thioredoxin-like negative regulator of GroEL/YHS domain-containing protein